MVNKQEIIVSLAANSVRKVAKVEKGCKLLKILGNMIRGDLGVDEWNSGIVENWQIRDQQRRKTDWREQLHDLNNVRIRHLRPICANLSNHLPITPIARCKRMSDEL